MWRVVALSAEVEHMQKTHCDHSVEHSIHLIWKNTGRMAATTPRKEHAQLPPVCKRCKRHSTTRGVRVISASGFDKNHKVNTIGSLRECFWQFNLERCLLKCPLKDTEVTRREFLCCASHLYWNSYRMYDTSLSFDCSISDTSKSSSLSFLSNIGLFSGELSTLSSSGTSSASPDATASSSASEFADLAWFELSLTTESVSSSARAYEKGL